MGVDRLPAIISLGFIAAYSETLAAAINSTSDALLTLVNCIMGEGDERVKGAAVWALGQLGRHSPLHAGKVAEAGVLRSIVAVMLHQGVSEELKEKCDNTLKEIISRCLFFPGLEPLLLSSDTPPSVLVYVLRQYAKRLITEQQAVRRLQLKKKKREEEMREKGGREEGGQGSGKNASSSSSSSSSTPSSTSPPSSSTKPSSISSSMLEMAENMLKKESLLKRFAEIGGLERVQTALKQYGYPSDMKEPIDQILACYPEDVVRQTNPDYQQELLKQIESSHE